VTHALHPTPAQLRCAAERVAADRHSAEITAVRAQHALAEELLGAVPPARQCGEIVKWHEHLRVAAIPVPLRRTGT
jgi:hypothetical protein